MGEEAEPQTGGSHGKETGARIPTKASWASEVTPSGLSLLEAKLHFMVIWSEYYSVLLLKNGDNYFHKLLYQLIF